ncbi:unnamed protein product, partial [Mesorhabditis spiculigera]
MCCGSKSQRAKKPDSEPRTLPALNIADSSKKTPRASQRQDGAARWANAPPPKAAEPSSDNTLKGVPDEMPQYMDYQVKELIFTEDQL